MPPPRFPARDAQRRCLLLVSLAGLFASGHLTKDQPPALNVDLLGLKAGIEPNLGHHVVIRIIAPPRPVLARTVRELRTKNPLDVLELQSDQLRALLAQKSSKRSVFAHGTYPSQIDIHLNTHTHTTSTV